MNELGDRLKQHRQRAGWSQRKLAAAAGVSNATISLIEHGRTDPSLGLMKRLLDVLELSFAEFFAEQPRLAEKVFYSHDELREISAGAIGYYQVGSDLRDAELQMLYERYAPGADTGPSMLSHEAEEGGVVIQGRLEVTVAERTRILQAGDAYRFDSRLPHRFRNVGDEECIVVSACTPPSF